MKPRKNDIIHKNCELILFLLIFLSTLLGCSSPNSGSSSYLNKHFDPYFGAKKVNGQEEQFYSSKLDSLLKTTNGIYLFPDIQGMAFQDYTVTVITRVKENQKLLLFFDRNNRLSDTLTIAQSNTFSLNAGLKNGKKGVCVGLYTINENYLQIVDVYEINHKIKLKKVTSEIEVTKCHLPQEYLDEENPELFNTFSFGKDLPKLTLQIKLLNGRWCERCDLGGSYFSIFEDELNIEISSSDYLTINSQLITGSNPREILISYIGVSSFKRVSTPEDQDAFIDENISRDKTIGKLNIINEKQVELIWYGLYDMVKGNEILKDELPFEKNEKGKYILNYCFPE